MPVLIKDEGTSDFLVRADRRGDGPSYRLTPEGERFLTLVLALRAGDEVRPSDLQLLLDRGWATLEEPAPEEPPAAPPAVPEREEPSAPLSPPRPAKSEGSAPLPRGEAPKSSKPRRTRAREVALQVLYQTEQNAGIAPEEIHLFIRRRLQGDRRLFAFAEALVAGVRDHQPRIDELISGVAENWRLDRMAAIDRNILRIGAYEMLFCPDVPTKVAINEALELAKRYSTAQSSRFVNGILDRLQAVDPSGPTPSAPEPPAAEAAGEPPGEPEGETPAVDAP